MCIYVLSSVLCYTSFKYLIGEKEVVTMSPASKAQQKAVNKYMKKNYDRVNLVMPKGRKDAIRTHAEKTAKVSMASSTAPLTKPWSGTRKLIEKNDQSGKVYGRKLTSINYPGLNYSISCSRNTVARMASR